MCGWHVHNVQHTRRDGKHECWIAFDTSNVSKFTMPKTGIKQIKNIGLLLGSFVFANVLFFKCAFVGMRILYARLCECGYTRIVFSLSLNLELENCHCCWVRKFVNSRTTAVMGQHPGHLMLPLMTHQWACRKKCFSHCGWINVIWTYANLLEASFEFGWIRGW